jgi:hypothetical protein
MITTSERAKTVHALDRSATVTGKGLDLPFFFQVQRLSLSFFLPFFFFLSFFLSFFTYLELQAQVQ